MNQLTRENFMKKARYKIYKQAILTWGANAQIIAAVEEFAELQVELAKIFNDKRDLRKSKDVKLLVDELADASIMLEQIKMMFSLDEVVEHRIGVKVKKLAEKLGVDYEPTK